MVFKLLTLEGLHKPGTFGGEAKVCGFVEIPVGMARINAIIGATVGSEEVPLLLSICFPKEVQAIADLQQGESRLSEFDATAPLQNLR